MEFHRPAKTLLGFRRIHALLAELVRTLPDLVEPSALSDEAQERLYPAPVRGKDEEELCADWKAFVEPGLQEHFRSNRDIVVADLKSLKQKGELFEFTIPLAHAEAWVNVLNQGRLVLAADLGFDEKLLAGNETPDLGTELGLTLFRINLYAFMQQCLIEQME